MDFLIGFIVGAIVGAAIAVVVGIVRGRAAAKQSETALQQMRETFAALAGEALDANTRRLTQQAATTLEGKKALIDQAVQAVNERLEQVRAVLQRVEADRKQDLGRLSSSVAGLTLTATKLHEMLASTQRRGAWGERMAEDVLRLAGLQEGINYDKQSSEFADGRERPDFTFYLPNDLKANMDVKFPLERYRSYIDAEGDEPRAQELHGLVQAVRGHVKAVAARGYIDPKVPTVPYVIVFIPNEQIYGLVLSAQPDLIDEALRQKVVLASPLTLYAMLCVVRQAAEHANIMKTADEVLTLLAQFTREWGKYNEAFEKLGQRIEQTKDEYERLRTTRTNMLQRPLDKIDQLRTTRGLPEE
jgi:DNA recombination protein RmuC